MAADLVEGEDADDVAAYVAKAVGQTGRSNADPATCGLWFRPCGLS